MQNGRKYQSSAILTKEADAKTLKLFRPDLKRLLCNYFDEVDFRLFAMKLTARFGGQAIRKLGDRSFLNLFKFRDLAPSLNNPVMARED